MSVAVMGTEAVWIVESPHDVRCWFAMVTPEDFHLRSVFVKCDVHHVSWWKTLVRVSEQHKGRLHRLYEYFHREGAHVATVFRPRGAGGAYQVEHHLQGDRFENIYTPAPPYSIIKLDGSTDAKIVQRIFDKNYSALFMGELDPSVVLQKLIDDGLIDGVLTKIDLTQ